MCLVRGSTRRRRQAGQSWRIISIWTSSPPGNQPAGRGYTDRSILVDAALHTKGESNLEYLQISQELDDLLRPVFRFTDKGEARAVTIPDLAFNIVDKVLHATFTLAFRDSIEEPEAPPLMAELESNIRTNRKE